MGLLYAGLHFFQIERGRMNRADECGSFFCDKTA
jgi:hypothetical protein